VRDALHRAVSKPGSTSADFIDPIDDPKEDRAA
jgi:hypothetical protein